MDNVVDILARRGLLEDQTNPAVSEVLDKPCVVYAGFDPTNASLQVGNLVTVMTLAHFQRLGHHVIGVVGGATGMIGDPSFKEGERALLSDEEVRRNAEGIRENLSRFLDFDHPSAPARILNNYDWLSEFSFLEFLREVGKHFRMGSMLGRESVRARLDSEAGLSYTEFSYQLLQAYDFLRLYDDERCIIQVGGSDQWGNITAGVELIRRLRGEEVYGITTPLICDSAGQKFGKSEGNAIFLDAGKTSVYDFYQYFVRSQDADVIQYLKVFTFLPLDEIQALESKVSQAPEERAAQKRLAEIVTDAVHSEAGVETARRASSVMYGESMEGLDANVLLDIFSDVPSTELSRHHVEGAMLADVAESSGLCSSKSAARRLIKDGGLYINNKRIGDVGATVKAADIVDGRLLVLRQGKKHFHLVRVV
jgi:tyrosyl-tRNA synthetase